MAMILCKECKQRVSNKAEKCPSCGVTIKKKIGCLTIVLVIFGAGVGLLLVMIFASVLAQKNKGSTKNNSAPEVLVSDDVKAQINKLVKEDIDVWLAGGQSVMGEINGNLVTTGSDIAAEYEANEARATKKYKGNVVVIKGRVVSIDTDLFDNPFVIIASNKNYGFNNPQLHFAKDDRDYPISLDKGDIEHFICKGDSEIIGSAMLKDCYSRDKYASNLSRDMLKRTEYYVNNPEKISDVSKQKPEIKSRKDFIDTFAMAAARKQVGEKK